MFSKLRTGLKLGILGLKVLKQLNVIEREDKKMVEQGKAWYESKLMWTAIASIVSGLTGLLSDSMQVWIQDHTAAALGILTGLGTVIAVFRAKTTVAIKGTDAAKTKIVAGLFALLLALPAVGTAASGDVGFSGMLQAVTDRISASPGTSSDSVYSESDNIGTLLTFTDCARSIGRGGVITGIRGTYLATTTLIVTVDIYDRSVTSAVDNAARAVTIGQYAQAHVVSLTVSMTGSPATGVREAFTRNLNVPYTCVGTKNLYGVCYLQASGGDQTIGGDTRSASKPLGITLEVNKN